MVEIGLGMIKESEVPNTEGELPMAVPEKHLTRSQTGARLREDQARINMLESQMGALPQPCMS